MKPFLKYSPFIALLFGVLSVPFGTLTAEGRVQSLPEEKLMFPAIELEKKVMPETFEGALFICAPHCEVLSINEAGVWTPELRGLRVSSDKTHIMRKDDPLYRFLFPPEDKSKVAASARQEQPKENEPEKAPAPPSQDETPQVAGEKVSYRHAPRVVLGLSGELFSHRAHETVQSAFEKSSNVSAADLELAYGLDQYSLLGGKWKFELNLARRIPLSQARLLDESMLKKSESELGLSTWLRGRKLSWGLRFASLAQDFSVDQDKLSSFSYSEEMIVVGLSAATARWRAEFLTDVGVTIKERQAFREKLLDFSWMRGRVQYCGKKFGVWRTIQLSPCASLMHTVSKNTSRMLPFYNPIREVTIARSETLLGLSLAYGGGW